MTLGIILLVFLAALFVYSYWFAPKGWRTRLFNWIGMAATGLVTGLQLLLPALDGINFGNVLPGVWGAVALILVQVGNAMLREVTSTSPGQKY